MLQIYAKVYKLGYSLINLHSSYKKEEISLACLYSEPLFSTKAPWGVLEMYSASTDQCLKNEGSETFLIFKNLLKEHSSYDIHFFLDIFW